MKPRTGETPPDDPYSGVHSSACNRRAGRKGLDSRNPAWLGRAAGAGAGRLERSFGRMPEAPCPLEPEVLGTLMRDGYAIERLTFQSRPGSPGHGEPVPPRSGAAALSRCVVGSRALGLGADGPSRSAALHRPGQAGVRGALRRRVRGRRARDRARARHLSRRPCRCIALAGGYPPDRLAGLRQPAGRRLPDLAREVDPARLAITGASGGGNQTLYAGATDDRLAAVIPVCGIGTYDAYLATACCVCEVNAGGATYATTGDLLAMVAPRALLVISATRDAFQFSVGEAAKSVAAARERFRLLGQEAKIRHVAIESGHDYNQPMREAMYGWVEKWLAGKGDGSPIPEPSIALEEVGALRCYPDAGSRPKTIMTIPEFALREGQSRLAALPGPPDHRERWHAESERMRTHDQRPDPRRVPQKDAPGSQILPEPDRSGCLDHDRAGHPINGASACHRRESARDRTVRRSRPGDSQQADPRGSRRSRRSSVSGTTRGLRP